MDHDINKRQTRLIKVHNWEFPGNDHNQLSLFGKKVFFFWERFWQSFLEQLITVSSLYKTAHEILYSQVWKSTHTSKTFLKVPIPKRGLLFEENEAFDCQTSEFLKKKTSVFHTKNVDSSFMKRCDKNSHLNTVLTRSDTFSHKALVRHPCISYVHQNLKVAS